ncbi:MAG: sigma-70 family RNA polymerase sigma factor [Acidobacteriota bacterium]|nr:sigma-70 family RNA polymerase sigma factor [Acidobacteriota bacterium]
MGEDLSNPATSMKRSMSSDLKTPLKGASISMTDEALLDRVRLRDQDSMSEIFDRYAKLVYSVAFRVLKDAESAEDVMQEIFFRLWEKPGTFSSGRGSFPAWLAVVGRNRAVDMLRRRKPTDPVDEVALAMPSDFAMEAERHIVLQRVREHLDTLPRDHRQSLELAFFEGLSHSEIAAQTGIPLGTIKTRIRSALISLREALQS